MYEDEGRSTAPVDDFKNGAWVGGKNVSTGEGFVSVALLGKGGRVPNLVDNSLTGKRVEWPPLFAMKYRVELQPRSRGFGAGLPAPLTDRHGMTGR